MRTNFLQIIKNNISSEKSVFIYLKRFQFEFENEIFKTKNASEKALLRHFKSIFNKAKLIFYLISVIKSSCGVLTFFRFTSQSFASSL